MQEVDEIEKLRMKKAEALLNQQKMPDRIVEIHSHEEFNKLIASYPDKLVVIDFWAVWCGPCMFFGPIFKKLHGEYKQDFIFVKVNVDENNSIARQYGISGIPTTLFIKNKEIVNKVVGAMDYERMKKVLEKFKE
jgi:thioredoxin 1